MGQAMQAQAQAVQLTKRSFLKLPVSIDVQALLADYHTVPRQAWGTSHWDVHCSADTLLLRGGTAGTAADFTTQNVKDSLELQRLPYLAHLIGEDGPFGQTTYAFLFRMKPMGVTRPHVDDDPAWYNPFRIHVPITTNDGAFLMSEGLSQHFSVGEVWTFDNQRQHAVVNGDSVRTHLIIDVLENPKLDALLRAATWHPGKRDATRWTRAALTDDPPSLGYGVAEPLSLKEKEALGLNPEGFASRLVRTRLLALLTRSQLAAGDIIFSVNGVEACEVARTALDYVQVRHHPGELIDLDVLRDGQRFVRRVRLYANPLPESVRRAWWRLAAKVS